MGKKVYTSPTIIEYGPMYDLTLGGSGPNLDITLNFTALTNNSPVGVGPGCPASDYACVNGKPVKWP